MSGLPVTRPGAARAVLALGLALAVAACARAVPAATAPGAPGFVAGAWHGFIFPFAWIVSLFDADVAVYAVPNSGGWYDFGYFVGITVLGGGSWFGSRSGGRSGRRGGQD
jgi:hypothetical protein